MSGHDGLRDNHDRRITYLRVSVTDRCNLRCVYCMPDNATFLPHEKILTYDEIERIVKVSIPEGIKKVRITGGEPLARENITYLVKRLSGMKELDDITLTTNGLALAENAQSLADAGLKRVNVSLDTLDSEKYKKICRAGAVEKVIDGIRAANKSGIRPVKINVVVLRGKNDTEISDFIDFGLREDVIIRFIEYMPIKRNGEWEKLYVSREEMLRGVSGRIETIDGEANSTHDPAKYFDLKGTGKKVGFISPVSHGFCSMCNRMRLTPDGKLLACLMASDGVDVGLLIRSGAGDDEIAEAIRKAVASKGREGAFDSASRAMHSIGG